MKMFSLILATLFAILCVASAAVGAYGTIAIFSISEVPPAVANVLVVAGFGLCLMLGFVSWIFYSVLGDGASDRDIRFGVGVPVTFAGAVLMYVGSSPEFSWGSVLLVFGMIAAILGTIHCIERIDHLLGTANAKEYA